MREIDIFTEGNISLPFNNIDDEIIYDLAEKILILTETDNVALSIILTDNEYIQQINQSFRQKNTPTDVISFAYRDEPFPKSGDMLEEIGDVYISLEKTVVQADEYGVTFTDEFKRLLIHGMLHLLGYDHEKSEEEEKKMNILEEKLIAELK